METKVLLIEDDPSIFEMIQERFINWEMQIIGPPDFQKVMDYFIEQILQLVIIVDIQLPAFDGFHWCREIRTVSKVPIIFLSSRYHPMDMVMAMQMGADDFIQKPFHMDVLLAKVQAILRRTYEYTEKQTELVRWNNATIDYAKGTVLLGGQSCETKNELFLLRLLLQRVDKVVLRDDLMHKLWDDERFVNDNMLTVNVNRLRIKSEEIGLKRLLLRKKVSDIWPLLYRGDKCFYYCF